MGVEYVERGVSTIDGKPRTCYSGGAHRLWPTELSPPRLPYTIFFRARISHTEVVLLVGYANFSMVLRPLVRAKYGRRSSPELREAGAIAA